VACPDSAGPESARSPRTPGHTGHQVTPDMGAARWPVLVGLATGPRDGRTDSGFRSRGSRPARTGYQEANAKIVVDVNVFPGPSVVDGKDGSLGESGKCWVSKVYPAPCR